MLKAHPVLRDALAAGQLSQSWARQFAAWNDRLPDAERDKADQVLLDAARDGLPLRPDIARLAQAIYEAVKGQEPDADPDDDGYADRGLRISATLGGTGRLHGDVTARCAGSSTRYSRHSASRLTAMTPGPGRSATTTRWRPRWACPSASRTCRRPAA